MNNAQRSLGSVLVVGGCGFLGRRIVLHLLESHSASSLAVLGIKTDHDRLPNVSYHDVDISSWEQVQSLFHQLCPDVVFHTVSPKPFAHDMSIFEKINVGGTRNLLEAAQEIGCVKAFIFTSTVSLLSDACSDLIDADETSPILYAPVQKSPYALTKARAEDLVLRANRGDGTMLTTSLRPSAIFGEGDPGILKPLVEAAASGSYRFQVGDGKNLFDWTYVGNVAQAHVQAAYALLDDYGEPVSSIPRERRVDGETFIITNDEPIAVWDFARSLGAAAGYPTNPEDIIVIPRFAALIVAPISEWAVWILSFGQRESRLTASKIRYSTMVRTFCIEKAKNRLHYKPKVGMVEGIRRAGESFSKKIM